jgi:hypothetical protein
MKTKTFKLRDVLTVTTGHFLTEWDNLYAIMGYLLGFSVYTHELVLYADKCEAELLRQFPQLAKVDASGVTPENYEAWIAEQEAKYGNEFHVVALSNEGRTESPVASAVQMMGGNPVIVVPVGDDDVKLRANQILNIVNTK